MVETDKVKISTDGMAEGYPADVVESEPAAEISEAVASEPAAEISEAITVDAPQLIHEIQWGHETLYTIAMWYTGKANHWRRLVDANPGIKPRRMRIGDKVRIPGPLLITRRPMPEDYLKPASAPKRKTAVRPPTRPPEPTQSPSLYGPVGDAPSAPAEEKYEFPVPLETIDD